MARRSVSVIAADVAGAEADWIDAWAVWCGDPALEHATSTPHAMTVADRRLGGAMAPHPIAHTTTQDG
jgi:hypothetical protein